MMSSKTVTKSRTHEEFMADQIKFEQQRYNKLKQVIEKEEEELVHRPSINKNSEKIVQQKLGESTIQAHERLYQSVKEGNMKTLKTQENEPTHVPQINKKS
jgi:hypothetical protein